MSHMIQYALVGWSGTFVSDTASLTDDEVRQRASCFSRGIDASAQVERYDRCPVCEIWTRTGGKLRRDSDCPAVKAALAKES